MFPEADLLTLPPLDRNFTGDTIGRYRLDRRVGYGGVASVYAATCKNTGAIFALKVLHPDHDGNAITVQRFRQEAQLGAQIRHANLIPVYDYSWLGGRHCIAMELVEGKTLSDVLASGAIGWERSTAIVCDLLAGLAALHERAVAHRDVSPNNCLLEDIGGRERARLFDLSHARVVPDAPRAPVLGLPPESVPMLIYGTPHFIAPERLRGSPGDFRADIFSIGALWYSSLTGEALPDPRLTDPVSVAQRLEIPPALHAVLLGALEIRNRRHHSAASMLSAIERVLGDLRSRRQRRRLWASAPLLSLLALPICLMNQSAPAEPACPPALSPASADRTTANVAAPVQPAPEPAPLAEQVLLVDAPALAPTTTGPVGPAPLRFDLRRALAKCKPHSTARIEIAIRPGEPVQIDGDRATGELGRCVEKVLLAHPPQRTENFKL
jgi:serine/threonine protein kinase